MSSYRMKYKIGNTQYHIPVIDDIGGGSGIPLGMILPYSANTLNPPYGFLWCDGSAVSISMYPELFALIGTLYGSGDGSTTFNLPDLTDSRFLEGTETAGTEKDAGLPNIVGEWSGQTFPTANSMSRSGAFSSGSVGSKYWGTSNSSGNLSNLKFDASVSNPIYGNSTTVQPKSLTTRYVIKAYDAPSESSAQIDISSYASALNGKSSKSLNDLTAAGEDHFLEKDFCFVYPNNGTEENPANIAANNRYVMDNPFPGYRVFCEAEIFYNSNWGKTGYYITGSQAFFADAAQFDSNFVVLQTGNTGIMASTSYANNQFGLNSSVDVRTIPCRIKVWKIGKIP